MISIELPDGAGTVNGPEDPELARLWSTAMTKWLQRHGRSPATKAEVRDLIADYQRMLGKTRGPLGAVVEQLAAVECSPADPNPRPG